MSAKILILEDERDIREMLAFCMEQAGYQVEQAATAERVFVILKEGFQPDLFLVDWMLPGASGIEFTKKLKKDPANQDLPVIMLTARGEEDDRVQGLEAGADDYVVKPFSPRELLARVQAVLRRTGAINKATEQLQHGDISIDTAGHRVTIRGEDVHLGPTEYKILHFFMSNVDRVFSRNQLLDSVWGQQVVVEERTVDVHIRRLRKALVPYEVENYVQTVRGSGYRFSSK
ncbi:phosphate regulon transcriptional regulator PhoB [Kangiella sp. HZ709]|uniref:phosphate regulon transcriptional regulator PhoB n=1 Tax=Kangiella sp. HZ709 TaxID=2666328 RepID=UPI0012B00158|nr:phosphate regulon transcriptional regulator PhoB [Kangiella sp. HZ709]MRX28588.1 phosphate regulon transcriptional regulatory protein PhoB [Kangiella sp. HZ709]